MTAHAFEAQSHIDGPLGPMLVAATATGLAGLWFDGQAHHPGPLDAPWVDDHPWINVARQALEAYWQSAAAPEARRDHLRRLAALPMDLRGTPFQLAVWRELSRLSWGQSSHYAALAQRIGRPAAVRAVGAAVGRNPVSLLVPCHRVLGRDGSLTGYAGGLDRKRALLKIEGLL